MIGTLLLFSTLNLSNLTPKIDVAKIIDSAGANAPIEIATDSSFSQKAQNFDAGQTIYVRVATDNEGLDKHNLNVHDGDYNLLLTYQLSRSGNQFTVDFAAPEAEGTYSVEADIESGGSVLNLVKTITVGGGGSQPGVKIENSVSSSSKAPDKVSGSPSASPSPTLNPTPDNRAHKANIFSVVWLVIFGFFKKIF